MQTSSTIFYQWQNPELRKTIYPFREEKLADFLLIYEEVDLWKTMRSAPVDQRLALELIQEYNRLNIELKEAKQANERVQLKYREIIRDKTIRDLVQGQINLQNQLDMVAAKKGVLERQVDWYQKFAPEHPFYQRYTTDLDGVTDTYQKILSKSQAIIMAYIGGLTNAMLAAASPQAAPELTANASALEVPSARIKRVATALSELPPLDKNGAVTQGAALRWRMLKRKRELATWDHDRLLAAVIERFDAEPQRFPKWLQYMVIHFSGMRYKSAHGSWASPRDLLEMLVIEDQKEWVQQAQPAELEQACTQASTTLQLTKQSTSNPLDAARIDHQITALASPFTRQATLLNFRTAQAVDEVHRLTEQEVLLRLEARKDQFPEWAWKEVLSRTELRLEVTEENWEQLSPAEQRERWDAQNQHWREIMDFWERKDITGWRKEHEVTLSLIVSRAVCNEIAEHIQHLRGIKPAAGLSAKPEWYLRLQRTSSAISASGQSASITTPQVSPYFRTPGTQNEADFRPGASILWLGWVDSQPNAWQIARPLPGIELLPAQSRPDMVRKGAARQSQKEAWNYRTNGSEYIRVSQPAAGPSEKKADNPAVSEWLRWTHEATVVEVVEMAGGLKYVLTFETGKIGLNKRPLRNLLNNTGVYIGYVPPAAFDPANLDAMLDRKTLLPPAAPAGISFDIPVEETLPELPLSETLAVWQSLSLRQQQVVALMCHELSVREIAVRLDVSQSTVKRDLKKAMDKFNVHRRIELRQLLARLNQPG